MPKGYAEKLRPLLISWGVRVGTLGFERLVCAFRVCISCRYFAYTLLI